jgi:hypothetical protein
MCGTLTDFAVCAADRKLTTTDSMYVPVHVPHILLYTTGRLSMLLHCRVQLQRLLYWQLKSTVLVVTAQLR